LSTDIKVKCRDPHEFLISVIYSLSYASTVKGPMLHRSLLDLGYTFTALDIPSIFRMPAPDLLLVSRLKKTVIAVECKGGTVEGSNLRSKFSDKVVEAIRHIVHDRKGEYRVEFVVNTFDIYADHYMDVIQEISKDSGKDILLWTTSAVPQVMADSTVGSPAEYYTLRKYVTPSYSVRHIDNDLDELLTQGVLIGEDKIVCNSLVNPEVRYPVLFYEVSGYILHTALSDRYRGQRIKIMDFVNSIKCDYQSPVERDRLRRVIIDVFEVFPELGEVKSSSQEIVFKRRPRINIERFYEIREKIVNMTTNDAKRYVRELKTERRS